MLNWIIAASIGLSYFSIAEFRALPLLLTLHFLLALLAIKKLTLINNIYNYLIFIILLVVIFYSIFSYNLNSLFAISCFFYIYISQFFFKIQKSHLICSEQNIWDAYITFALLNGLVILCQVVLYVTLQVELFRKVEFSSRIAFSGLWTDFSVLSIYLASAVPLISLSYLRRKYSLQVIASLILIVASILTSARSGIVALLTVYVIYFLMSVINNLILLKIPKRLLLQALFIFAAVVGAYLYYFELESFIKLIYFREEILSDESRLSSYESAYKFFLQNPFFGTRFDDELYLNSHPYLPHNFIFYILISGGIVFGIPFLFWISIVFYYLIFLNETLPLKLAFFIAIIGSMFVPSFFSLYFIACISANLFFINKSYSFYR